MELSEALAIVLAVNCILWLGQVAALQMNPEGPQFYNCQGSMIGSLEASQCAAGTYVLDDSNPAAKLPTAGGTIEVDSGQSYTDTFAASNNWFTDVTGLNYLYNILAAPSNFLKGIGVPSEFSFAVGAMWYGLTLFLIIAFILGRN